MVWSGSSTMNVKWVRCPQQHQGHCTGSSFMLEALLLPPPSPTMEQRSKSSLFFQFKGPLLRSVKICRELTRMGHGIGGYILCDSDSNLRKNGINLELALILELKLPIYGQVTGTVYILFMLWLIEYRCIAGRITFSTWSLSHHNTWMEWILTGTLNCRRWQMTESGQIGPSYSVVQATICHRRERLSVSSKNSHTKRRLGWHQPRKDFFWHDTEYVWLKVPWRHVDVIPKEGLAGLKSAKKVWLGWC